MNGLSTPWKIFRVVCIIQLVLVAFRGMLSFTELFYPKSVLFSIIETLIYAIVFVFVYQGLSMLNYNYPDIPLSPKQKRWFNGLYVVNFLLIAFLFARVVNTWWLIPIIIHNNISSYGWFSIVVNFLFAWVIFIIHLLFLAGMFRLRRQIHQNTITTWYQQFEKTEE